MITTHVRLALLVYLAYAIECSLSLLLFLIQADGRAGYRRGVSNKGCPSPTMHSPVFIAASRGRLSVRRDCLICPNIASRALWPFHITLIGGDVIEMTGIARDFVNCRATWEQCLCFRHSTVILQWTNL